MEQPKTDIAQLEKENRMLKRRVERMTKEMQNLINLHDRALKLRDYSEQEKQLQYEYNYLLLENAPDMIFILDQELRFRLGTKAFLSFLGQPDQGILYDMYLGDLLSPVMPLSWIRTTLSKFETAVTDKQAVQYTDEVTLGGETRVFSISIAPAVDSKGDVMGAICLMHDSTELVRMKEGAEAATRAKSSFLASMSHEIRTPMNAIKGLSDLMSRTHLTDQQAVYTENIRSATGSLLKIIDDILDFSKIEANRYEIINVDYDMASELTDLCNLMYPKAEEKGLYFAVGIRPDLPCSVQGDNVRIRQILINIINNAIKFTHKGGIRLDVSGEAAEDGVRIIRYTVSDTGQGIKEEELPQIFQAFKQADFYKNRNIAGTGLGLAISKNLAELMNGTISVSSEYGNGTCFTVRIPQKISDPRPLASLETSGQKRLLLLSEIPDILSVIGVMLDSFGIPYDTVLEEKEAERLLERHSYSHILTDGSTALACRLKEKRPDLSVACLRSISNFASEQTPDGVRTLLHPLLPTTLSAFLDDKNEIPLFQGGEEKELGRFSLPDARILIVDDNEINLIVASEIIRTYSIEPDTALSGEEAIGKIKNREYDLIFMDHMMPGMDGVETTRIIRSLPDIRQPVIIALTANAILGMEKLYLESGFNGYITKPIDLRSLNRVLEKWLVTDKEKTPPGA